MAPVCQDSLDGNETHGLNAAFGCLKKPKTKTYIITRFHTRATEIGREGSSPAPSDENKDTDEAAGCVAIILNCY